MKVFLWRYRRGSRLYRVYSCTEPLVVQFGLRVGCSPLARHLSECCPRSIHVLPQSRAAFEDNMGGAHAVENWACLDIENGEIPISRTRWISACTVWSVGAETR